jgi:Rieske Fe-S protein
MDRNEFIRLCSMGALTIPAFISGCSSSQYFAKSIVIDNQIKISKSEFIEERNGKILQRKFILVRTPKLPLPICIYKIDDNLVALYTKCSHQGCEVKPQGDYLVCPCHGSEYSSRGKVINPPAEVDLQEFKVTSIDAFILITI